MIQQKHGTKMDYVCKKCTYYRFGKSSVEKNRARKPTEHVFWKIEKKSFSELIFPEELEKYQQNLKNMNRIWNGNDRATKLKRTGKGD